MRSALMVMATLACGTAAAADKDQLEVIGFSEDGKWFAYWTWGVSDGSGFPHAELNVHDVGRGRRDDKQSQKLDVQTSDDKTTPTTALDQLKVARQAQLDQLKLGKDPGVELYKSGTPTRTSFTLAGRELELRLLKTGGVDRKTGLPRETIALTLTPKGGKARLLFKGGEGFDFSLNSVRLSADGKSLAVFLKHSVRGFEGADRRFLLVPARL